MRRAWCWIAGHRWEHIGETYRGTTRVGNWWKCKRCRDERTTSRWTRPTPW